MADFNLVPGLLNINAIVGNDFSMLLDFSVDLSDYTFEAKVILQNAPANSYGTFTITEVNLSEGRISLNLSDIQTRNMGPLSHTKWFLSWSVGGNDRTVLSGKFALNPPWAAGDISPTSETVPVVIDDTTVLVTVIGGAGGSILWGDIQGDIEDQTDLIQYLQENYATIDAVNEKADQVDIYSGDALRDYFSGALDITIARSTFIYTGGVITGKRGFQAGVGYPNQTYLRDLAMMIRGQSSSFTSDNLLDHLKLFIDTAGPNGQVWDSVNINGDPLTSGGFTPNPGVNPAASYDNCYELVDIAYSHYLMTGTTEAYETFSTGLDAAMDYVNIVGNLVNIEPSVTPFPTIGFGFQDVIASVGDECMTSVLRFRALKQMSEMALKSGDTTASNEYLALANPIPASLQAALWDASVNLFRNATVVNTQHTIPGSAYAVVVGCCSDTIANLISQKLLNGLPGHSDALSGKGFVQDGQIRHLPNDENWTSLRGGYPLGTYQNGAYWAPFTGWVATAIARLNESEAIKLLGQLFDKLKSDSIDVIPVEASNTDVGYTGSSQYGVSVSLPLYYWNGTPLRQINGVEEKGIVLSDLLLNPDLLNSSAYFKKRGNGVFEFSENLRWTYSTPSSGAGSIILNNHLIDAPKIKWLMGDNLNFAIRPYVLDIEFLKNADETGTALLGSVTGDGFVVGVAGFKLESNVGRKIMYGHFSPESVATADPGSLYIDFEGGATPLWAKNSGTGNTGWISLIQYGGVEATLPLQYLRRNSANTAYEFAVLPASAPTNATYITQTSNGALTNEQALSGLATGLLKNTTTTGVLTVAVAGADYLEPSGSGSLLSGVMHLTGNETAAGVKTFSSPPVITSTVGGSSGMFSVGLILNSTANQSGTAGYDVIRGNVIETATGSGAKNLIRLSVASVDQFTVTNTGAVTAAGAITGSNLSGTNTGDQTLNGLGVYAGSFSGVGTVTTDFVVTIGATLANNTYKVNVTPTAVLSAAIFYISAKTTTTFTVTYLAGLTGTVTFDWILAP